MKKLLVLVCILLLPAISALFGETGNFGYNQIEIPTNQNITVSGGSTTNNYYNNYTLTAKGNPPYLYNDSDTIYFNETQLNITIDDRATGGTGDNASWNQSYATTLFANIKWGYNMTTATYDLYNAIWSSTYNATYDATTSAWNGNSSALLGCINNESYLSTYNATYDAYALNVSKNWTQLTYDTYDARWYNVAGDSIGYYINYTPVTTTGNITNGTLRGYLAGNAICNVYYAGSHMCQIGEILNSINRNQSNENFTATFRATEGAPGYLANANDCDGLTSPTASDLGSIFVGSTSHINTYGSASLVSCSAQRAIGCCK